MAATPITGIPLVDFLLGILGSYGYLITFAATVLENIFVVGSVTPGETVVMAAGFVASTKEITVAGVWFASFFGTVIGSNISYTLGRVGGRQALERYGERFFISQKRIDAAEEYFAQHGSKTVLLARFAAGVKNFVPMIAGVSRMNGPLFELYTVIGAAVYTTAMVLLGYYFGENFGALLKWVRRAGLVGLVLLVAVIVAVVWGRLRYRRRRVQALAEAEESRRSAEEPDAHGE